MIFGFGLVPCTLYSNIMKYYIESDSWIIWPSMAYYAEIVELTRRRTQNAWSYHSNGGTAVPLKVHRTLPAEHCGCRADGKFQQKDFSSRVLIQHLPMSEHCVLDGIGIPYQLLDVNVSGVHSKIPSRYMRKYVDIDFYYALEFQR